MNSEDKKIRQRCGRVGGLVGVHLDGQSKIDRFVLPSRNSLAIVTSPSINLELN